jgi:hypothetical protein
MNDRMKALLLVPIFLATLTAGCSSGANDASAPASSSNDSNANATASASPKAETPAPNTLPLLPQPPAGLPSLSPEAKPPAKPATKLVPSAAQAVPSPTSPRLVLPVSNIDFGSVNQGKSLVRNLVVKNTGRSDLNIESVAPS